MRSTLEAWDAEMVEVNGIAEAKTETMEEQAADPCDVMEPDGGPDVAKAESTPLTKWKTWT